MSVPSEYPDELRQRAVRMVFDVREETGNQPEAIKRVADELGVPPNMLWQWVERAARSGSSDATPTADPDAYESGMQLVEFGALDEAQTSWGAAAEAGDTTAAFNLGVLLVQRGQLDEAADWWRTAADAGDSDAAARLGCSPWDVRRHRARPTRNRPREQHH
ncbi:MAG: transposase [Pseudonocardiaceae bacterium]